MPDNKLLEVQDAVNTIIKGKENVVQKVLAEIGPGKDDPRHHLCTGVVVRL